jgi:hypothetical protein
LVFGIQIALDPWRLVHKLFVPFWNSLSVFLSNTNMYRMIMIMTKEY